MELSTRKISFFVGKKKRDFEIDHMVIRTAMFSIFLTQSLFVFKKGSERLRLVFWVGRHNQVTKQVFLW